MANKFILAIAMFALMLVPAFALAAECGGSGTTKLITYSPNDLNVGEEFNLTFIDLFGGVGEQVTLNYPSSLSIISGAQTVTLLDYGTGEGYFTWRMNSTAPGNHTVYVNISYNGVCNVTRTIEIKPTLLQPNITLSYITTPGDAIARQNKAFSLIISNTGVGTAYNVSGWTNFGSVIDKFNYTTIAAGNSEIRNFNVNTAVCGVNVLESTVNYKDSFGYSYPPSHISQSINVVGSDLELEEFEISKDKVRKGEIVKFKVKVTNKARSTTINASNVIVKIYKGNDKIEEISLGDVAVNETVEGEGQWKASGSGTLTLKAVVSSDNECSNWNNNEISRKIKIRAERREEEEEEEEEKKEEEEKEEEEKPTPTPPIAPAEKEAEFPWALPAIILEALALVLLTIYAAKKRKRFKLSPEPKPKKKKK